MKTTTLRCLLPCCAIFLGGLPSLQATDLTAANLTLSSSMTIGQVHIDAGAMVPGMRITVDQDVTEETFTHSVYYPGESYVVETVNDEYGYVEVGGYEDPIYEYGLISSYWVDEVWGDGGYWDEENNWIDGDPYLIEAGHYEEEWGDVITGYDWVAGTMEWQVIGSYTTSETVEGEGHTETITETQIGYGSPKIKQAATRTDANWVWQVPSAGHDGSNLRDILVLFDGGLSLPSRDPTLNMAMLADNLTYTREVAASDHNAVLATRTKAGGVEVSADRVFSDESTMNDKANLSAQFVTFRYNGTDPNTGQPTSKISRVGAESAYFDGLVTVNGNVNVGGVLRLPPAGNLTMGEFQDGPPPVVTAPSAAE